MIYDNYFKIVQSVLRIQRKARSFLIRVIKCLCEEDSLETEFKKKYNFHRYRLKENILDKGKDVIQVTEESADYI